MKKIIFLTILTIGTVALCSCAKKAEEPVAESENPAAVAETQAEAAEEIEESETEMPEVQAKLSETGDDMTANPIFDPYNAYASLGKDQSEFVDVASGTDEYQFYDYDDCDVHVYAKGLSDYYTDSYSSYLQLWTKKGEAVPYKISYVDSYKGDGAEQFAEDFEYLDIALENAYGAPVAVGYVDKDGNINQGSISELIRDIDGINETDGGFAFVEYDSGDTSVSLNAMYDAEGDIYTIFIDME